MREGKGVLGVAMGVVSFAPVPTAPLTLRGSWSGCFEARTVLIRVMQAAAAAAAVVVVVVEVGAVDAVVKIAAPVLVPPTLCCCCASPQDNVSADWKLQVVGVAAVAAEGMSSRSRGELFGQFSRLVKNRLRLGTYTNAPGVSAKAASVEVRQLEVESRTGREHVLSFVRLFVRLLVVSCLSWFYSKHLYSHCSCPWFACLELQMPCCASRRRPPRSSVAQQACPSEVDRWQRTANQGYKA